MDFQELYYKFAKDSDKEIQKSIASSLHEAFLLTS